MKALAEYGPLIDGARTSHSSLSKYRVIKPWGYEVWLALNKFFALKLIHMNAGNRSSLQKHSKKIEANYVIEGCADILIENTDTDVMEQYTMKAGEGWTVKPGQRHRVIAEVEYTALEASSPHLNDVIRIEDDNGRKNGRIMGEHLGRV